MLGLLREVRNFVLFKIHCYVVQRTLNKNINFYFILLSQIYIYIYIYIYQAQTINESLAIQITPIIFAIIFHLTHLGTNYILMLTENIFI